MIIFDDWNDKKDIVNAFAKNKLMQKSFVQLVLFGICAFVLFRLPIFHSTLICFRCGMVNYRQDRQLPYIPFTWKRTNKIEHTPLSRLLTEEGIIASHEHDWIFVAGNGNFIVCALGDGRSMMGVHEDQSVSFIRNIITYLDKKTARRWALRILHPDISHGVLIALRNEEFPEEGFEKSEQFEIWWNDRIPRIEVYLDDRTLFRD